MNKADEMFEKLRYKLDYEDEICLLLLNNKEAKYITFMKDTKTLMLPILTMQELQAIYQKCKELGWLDE